MQYYHAYENICRSSYFSFFSFRDRDDDDVTYETTIIDAMPVCTAVLSRERSFLLLSSLEAARRKTHTANVKTSGMAH